MGAMGDWLTKEKHYSYQVRPVDSPEVVNSMSEA